MAAETDPLLTHRPANQAEEAEDDVTDTLGTPKIEVDRKALICLLMQHTSSVFGHTVYNFASYIILVEVYKDTIVPASLVGLGMRLAGLLFSGYVGNLIDRTKRIKYVGWNIAVQKGLEMTIYGLLLILLVPMKDISSPAFHGQAPLHQIVLSWSILLIIVVCSGLITLSGVGMDVAIERDWVTTISQGDPAVLTYLNSWMKTISLVSKLFPPLLGSLLTFLLGYPGAVVALIVLSAIAMIFEFWWIKIVYSHFPILRIEEEQRFARIDREASQAAEEEASLLIPVNNDEQTSRWSQWNTGVKDDLAVWREFMGMPIFFASLATSIKWVETLSMDGIGISYFHTSRGWDDGILALIRAGCLLAGVLGATFMPSFERLLGTSRVGLISIAWSAIVLVPTVFIIFVDSDKRPSQIPLVNSLIMIAGIVWARGGVMTFNLAQTKQLQLSLASHPRRNRMAALQSALQNSFSLIKFALTLYFSSPGQFKWTTVATLSAHVLATASYALYIARVRYSPRRTV